MIPTFPKEQQPTYVVVAPIKSSLLAYVLWFFLGGIGGHKFYLRQTGLGIAYLLATLIGGALSGIGLGFITFVPLGIALIVDLFIIPARVLKINMGQA